MRFLNQTVKLAVAEIVLSQAVIFFIGNINVELIDFLPVRVLRQKHHRKCVMRNRRAEFRIQCVNKFKPFDSTTSFGYEISQQVFDIPVVEL